MAIEPWRADVDTEALDQWLRAALAVDPSPAFVAKTRARIATETQRRPWLISLLLIIGTALIYFCLWWGSDGRVAVDRTHEHSIRGD